MNPRSREFLGGLWKLQRQKMRKETKRVREERKKRLNLRLEVRIIGYKTTGVSFVLRSAVVAKGAVARDSQIGTLAALGLLARVMMVAGTCRGRATHELSLGSGFIGAVAPRGLGDGILFPPSPALRDRPGNELAETV